MTTRNLYEIWGKSNGICTDTRVDVEGNLFFALSGDNFNGNKFAADAIKKGAIAAVIDDPEYYSDKQRILVDNTLKALQDLALFHRKRLNTAVLAISGSNGKTTTKELIAAALSKGKNIVSTKGNFNNHIGVPLSLLKITKDTELAIIEMGANHPGEIETLCNIALPNLGILTNIGKAHLEGFGSFEGVVKTKNELYKSIRSTGGKIILNADDKLLVELAGNTEVFSYGSKNANVIGKILRTNPTLSIEWSYNNAKYQINSQLYGQYNFPNIMAAIACGVYFGISPDDICLAIEEYLPDNNRSQLIKTSTNTIILDAYNANPVSMKNAIESFKSFNAEKPLLILGDMFELGGEAEKEHQEIIRLLNESGFKNIYLVGEEFYKYADSSLRKSFRATPELKIYLEENKIMDKTILIKGSRGMKLESILDTL